MRAQLEAYYDGVPRTQARTEDFGSLTLFVRDGPGWQYYARPTLGSTATITVDEVRAVLDRQKELGIPQSFEWVAETTPSLEAAVSATDLDIHRHPLMVLSDPAVSDVSVPDGITVRILTADDPALASAIAAAHLGFGEPGTALGRAGVDELRARTTEVEQDGSPSRTAERIASGLTVMAAALDSDGNALCSGGHNPLGPTTEIVGVGTVPSARRQGLGHAVTAALVDDARGRGIETIFLSAGDEDVARIYARIGFRRIGTALIAEPADDNDNDND